MVKDFLELVPIPTAGLALGLVALGNLLHPYSELLYWILGCIAFILVCMLAAKYILHPHLFAVDMQNSILASVAMTFYMAWMQLSTYINHFNSHIAFVLWFAALGLQLLHMVWFGLRYFGKDRFKLNEVFPTYFIAFVGVIVGSVTAPSFGMQIVGRIIFWLGFVLYAIPLVLVTVRYIKHEVPKAALPLFCIYTAPMSLSLAGYESVYAQPNLAFVATLAILGQILYLVVLSQLPKFVFGSFFPSFAAMTFPFVITAVAAQKTFDIFVKAGWALPEFLHVIVYAEIGFSTLMVLYVFARYSMFFWGNLKEVQKTPQEAGVLITETN